MTESRLQAENNELREQVEDLIKENQRLVDTIFEKQAIIDELEKTK